MPQTVLTWLTHFALMVSGNICFYYAFFKMSEWAKANQRIVIEFLKIDWDVPNYWLFVLLASAATLPVGFVGGYVTNFAYIRESLNSGSLWISQFMLWLAAPIAFFIFSKLFLPEPPASWPRVVIAVILLLSAQLVLRWK